MTFNSRAEVMQALAERRKELIRLWLEAYAIRDTFLDAPFAMEVWARGIRRLNDAAIEIMAMEEE